MVLSRSEILERVTGELHRRYLCDNAERWHRWAQETPGVDIARYDMRALMEWAEHLEMITPTLTTMVRLLALRTYSEDDADVILYWAMEYGWVANSRSRGSIEYRRVYTSEARISHMLIRYGPDAHMHELKSEVENMLICGVADMFEDYYAEGLFPLVPIPGMVRRWGR